MKNEAINELAKAVEEANELRNQITDLKREIEAYDIALELGQRTIDEYYNEEVRLKAEINSKAAQAWEEGYKAGYASHPVFNSDTNPYLPKQNL